MYSVNDDTTDDGSLPTHSWELPCTHLRTKETLGTHKESRVSLLHRSLSLRLGLPAWPAKTVRSAEWSRRVVSCSLSLLVPRQQLTHMRWGEGWPCFSTGPESHRLLLHCCARVDEGELPPSRSASLARVHGSRAGLGGWPTQPSRRGWLRVLTRVGVGKVGWLDGSAKMLLEISLLGNPVTCLLCVFFSSVSRPAWLARTPSLSLGVYRPVVDGWVLKWSAYAWLVM